MLLFWLALTLSGWCQNRVFLAVIGADKTSTYQIAEEVRSVRELFGLSKSQLQIARIPVQKLSPADLKRVGFNAQSLPVLAVLQISSANNLEKVIGSPPLIVRQVQRPRAAAQALLCRWARQHGSPIPAELIAAEQVFRPGQIAVLALSDSDVTRKRLSEEWAILQGEEELGGRLPCYVSSYQDEFLPPADLQRLGFGPESETVVCLVKMSEACNPSEIVQQCIVRYVGRPREALQTALRGWAERQGIALKKASARNPVRFLECTLPASLSPNVEVALNYRVDGFQYGPKSTGWLQEEFRLFQNGALIREELRSRRQEGLALDSDMRVETTLKAPDRPGSYELELKIRDKFGHTTDSRRQPLEVK